MPDLIAQGPQPDDRWRKRLDAGVRLIVGRQAGPWSTPWDNLISRQHIEIHYDNGQLFVEVLPSASNAVFFRGHEQQRFRLKPGEHFVIGRTTFSLVDPRASAPHDLPRPTDERTFAADDLLQRPFREPDKRIQALSRLPDIVHRTSNDQELFQRLVNLLLSGIDQAHAAAVVSLDEIRKRQIQTSASATASDDAAVTILHWDRHLLFNADFRPSQRLIRQAVSSGQSVAHVWNLDASHRPAGDFTASEQTEWAICTPIENDACPGWALYVAGSFSGEFSPGRPPDAELLHDDVKYTQIMATTLGGLRQAQQLAARQASLGQFFSPVVMHALSDQDPEQVLAPREVDVTVMFCDLRGFTSESERMASDLFGLLGRVSEALGVMTRHILEQGGVIGDFHGDAAMGFWGWPIAQPDAVVRACRAALGIRTNFAADASCDPATRNDSKFITNFRCGIGLATGRAVAGKIGTTDQVKVTAFGPVVNLASRLETMTKQFSASILTDGPTARLIGDALSPEICRIRRLARVLPVGLSTAIDVHEILPPERDCPELPTTALTHYESALTVFELGDWQQAQQLLAQISPADRAKELLLNFIDQHAATPPSGWTGTIPLSSK